MAKKNLFISIGSTSTGALVKLIERLIDLDIYKPLDPNYKDMFVAIDTDNGPLEKILTFNSGEIAHTFAASFTRSGAEPPVPSHTFLRNSYRSDWDKESLAIKAADRGVGGQRIKSFATLEWKDTVRNVILTFLKGAQGDALLNDYQVILVSSSWGGTASGLFQNVSDFIASQLYERCGGSNNQTPFYAVLALPNYESAQSDRESKGYQGLENFAYFMRDVQQAGWRGSLPKIRNNVANENLSFIFPEFCNLDNNGKVISVDASSGSSNFCGNRSALPQRAIIVVPTLGGSSTAITVAEQLLALGYLDIFKQPIDREGTVEVDGKFIDIRKAWDSNATNDCPALMGLNMVECQYSRYSVIAAVIKKELIKRWENFYSIYPGNDMAIKSLVREFIQKQIKMPAHSKEQKEHVLDSLGGQWVDDSERLKVLKSKVVDFRDAVANDAYEFPRFDAAEELLAKFVEYTEGLNDKQKIVCEKSVTLEDIRQAYIQLLNEWYALAQRDPKDLEREINAIIDNTVEQYNAIKKGKGFGGKIIKYCNGETQVLDELVAIARKLIEEKLDELQKLMCARATGDKFSLEKENKSKVVNNPRWQTANDQINRIKQECNDSDSEGENKFIKIVRNTALEGALQRNNLVNVTIEKCIELLKNSGDEASCQSCCEKLCRELVDATIAEMERRDINGVDDPAIITLKDSKVTGCCPGFYAPFEGGVRVHFYAKNNGATDVDWQDIDNFAFNSFVNLKKTEVNSVTPVSQNHLHNYGAGVWWEENLTYDDAPLYGMWLGALDLNLTFKSVLSRVYTNRISQDIQDSAYRLVMDSKQQQEQCLQSLFEKIVIGAIWGIFNDTLQNKALNEGQTLSLKLTTPSGEVIWTKSSKRESDLGLLADDDGINVNFISDEFIRTIMPWTQDDNGKCRLAEAFDCQELYSLLLRQERFILTNIRLAPTEEQANAIVEFYNKLKQCIDVTVE